MADLIDLISAVKRIRRKNSSLLIDIQNNEKLFINIAEEISSKIIEIIIFEEPEIEYFLLADYKGDNSPQCETIGNAIGITIVKIISRSCDANCNNIGDMFISNVIQNEWLRLGGREAKYFQNATEVIGQIVTSKCLVGNQMIGISLDKNGRSYSLNYSWVY